MNGDNTPNRISWQAPEFDYYPKTKNWFLVSGIIAALILFWAIWNQNWLFAIIIVMGYFSMSIYALKKPDEVTFTISGKGIGVGNVIYKYDDLMSFWIFYDPPILKELSLRSKRKVMPYIKIPLGEQNPVEVRGVLSKYLSGRKHRESLIDNLARAIRF